MCAIIRIKWKAFRTVISRAESCSVSKGCRVSRHPSGVKDHPGSTGDRANRTEYCTEAAWSAICEEMPGCRETRHPGIFTMYFCQIVPIIHFHSPDFPCAFTKFVCTMKTGSLPWLTAPLQHLQKEDRELPDIASQLTALAKNTQMWSTATIMWQVSS